MGKGEKHGARSLVFDSGKDRCWVVDFLPVDVLTYGGLLYLLCDERSMTVFYDINHSNDENTYVRSLRKEIKARSAFLTAKSKKLGCPALLIYMSYYDRPLLSYYNIKIANLCIQPT